MNKINDFLQKTFIEERLVGMSVAITDREKTLATFNFGVQNAITKEPITDQTRFRIASITKVVTGLTILQLVEQGKLCLTQSIGAYVPWLKGKLADLTLASLLSHTAGLPKEYTPKGTSDEGLLEQSLINELGAVDLEKVGNGSPYLYSNLGIRLASLIAEKVSGEKFSTLSQRLVLTPLGMQDTFYQLQKALLMPLALPHEKQGEEYAPVEVCENAVRYAAGGLFSTATDLCKLARCLLNDGVNDKGERVIGKEILQQAFIARTDNTGDKYGYTIMLHPFEDRVLIGHKGSAPPYCSALFTDKKSGYGVALLINTAGKEHLRNTVIDGVFALLNEQ